MYKDGKLNLPTLTKRDNGAKGLQEATLSLL